MTNYDIAVQWLQAFNEHNLEKLLALYDNEAVHYSPKLKIRRPETEGLIKGKNELGVWWQDAFDRLPHLKYIERTITADNNRVFMEYTRVVPGEEDMNVAEVLEIKNWLIIESRVYHG